MYVMAHISEPLQAPPVCISGSTTNTRVETEFAQLLHTVDANPIRMNRVLEPHSTSHRQIQSPRHNNTMIYIHSALITYLANVLIHTANAAWLFYMGHIGMALVIFLLQTAVWSYFSITLFSEGKVSSALMAFFGVFFIFQAIHGNIESHWLVEFETAILPISYTPLIYVYSNMLLYGKGIRYVDGENTGESIETIYTAFGRLHGSRAILDSVVHRYYLCFCILFCCISCSFLINKNHLVLLSRSRGGLRSLFTQERQAFYFVVCSGVYHTIDIGLRMLSLTLITSDLFAPLNFITVFFSQTMNVALLLAASASFLPAFLKSLLALVISALPQLLEDDDDNPRRVRLCLLLLLLRYIEFVIIFGVCSSQFNPIIHSGLYLASIIGGVLTFVNIIILLSILKLRDKALSIEREGSIQRYHNAGRIQSSLQH